MPMKPFRSLFFLLILLIPSSGFSQTPLDTLSLKSIFHEPYIPGVRPSFAGFSPDGKTVYFRWDDEAGSDMDVFQIPIKGGDFEEAPEDLISNYTLSPDGKKLVFQKKGDIMIADKDFKNERLLVGSKSWDGNPTFSPDGSQLAFVADGDVWITGVNEAFIKQVTNKSDETPGFGIVGWAGDEKLVLSQWDNSAYKEYFFPEYVGKYVDAGRTERGIPTTILSVVGTEGGKVKELFKGDGRAQIEISADGSFVVSDWVNPEMKNRVITSFDVSADTSYVIFEDSTKGWLYGTDIAFSPEGSTLMIQSEKDGWNHIYTVDATGGELTQHTFGGYDVPYVSWLSNKEMLIATSEFDRGDIQIFKLNLANNEKKQLTSADGHRRGFRLTDDHKYLVYSKTYFNEPAELYALEIAKGKEIRLTDSTPEGFEEMGWQKEDYVKVTSRDGETPLSTSILTPKEIDEANGNPVVVFVHGAGSLQNVFQGWSFSYWREYMFNQYLTKQGYYVIEVDYRHSTGYGRKFREDVTNWMGKYETEDIEDGLAYLADNYPGADTSRVGIYGGSYGGFMALYAVGTAPEHFDAAAALRSVTNWENYYHTNPWYTLPRLGTPEADSANYARSSPITYADSLQKPVLLLHGLIDNNVGFQDAAQYIERLIQTGNEDFDLMMYPSERHGFRDPDSWYDEYRRIYEFFEEKLK